MAAIKTVNYKGVNTNVGPSPAIWGDCPWLDILSGAKDGVCHHDDFTNQALTVPTTQANFGIYKGFSDTGGFLSDADEVGGVMKAGSDGDNEGASIADVNLPLQISRSHKKLWFEARVKTSTIADTKHGFFLGLGEAMTLSATVPIAAAGTLADQNFVGFHKLEGDGDQVDVVYKADTVTQVTVQTDAQVLVADTFMKLGMIYFPKTYALKFYANGTQIASYTVASAAGTDFPNDVRMGRILAVLNATGSTPGQVEIDWWRYAQLR